MLPVLSLLLTFALSRPTPFTPRRKARASLPRPWRPRPSFRPRLEALEDRCLLSAGVLDPTFGTAGMTTTALAGTQQSSDIAVYPTGTANAGKTVVVRTTTYGGAQFLIMRYNVDGSLDTSFDKDGIVTTDFERNNGWESATTVAVQSDGKIVVGGYVSQKFTTNDYLGLARYNADGSLDKSFGTGGKVTVSASSGIASLFIQPDGKIVGVSTLNNQPAIVRFLANGKLDTSLDGDGFATLSANHLDAVTLEADGKFVVGGNVVLWTRPDDPSTPENEYRVFYTSAFWRLNANGSPDTSFGTNGRFTLNLHDADGNGQVEDDDYDKGLAMQADGKMIALVASTNEVVTVRLDSSGALDSSYGTNGVTSVSASTVAPGKAYVNISPDQGNTSLALQADGKAVVAVRGSYLTNPDEPDPNKWIRANFTAVLRYNTDGALDSSWGNGGVVINYDLAFGEHVAIQPDGKIMIQGANADETDVVLARYLASAPQIGSFTASPNPATAGSPVTLTASNITDANPGATVTQVTFYYFDSNGNQQVLGTATQSNNGAWSMTFTVNLAAGSYTLYAQAEDSDGVFGDPFALPFTVQ